jgi:hypothetical protein
VLTTRVVDRLVPSRDLLGNHGVFGLAQPLQLVPGDAMTPRTAYVLLALSAGCGEALPEYFGPLCEDAERGEWAPALVRPELDRAEHYEWTADEEVERTLRGFGMDDAWDRLAGNDVSREGIVVSPYGKTLNAYELIVMTTGLEGWGEYVRDHTYAVHGSCGLMGENVVAHTFSGRNGYRTDVFEPFYQRDVVSRAGFIIHEVGHAAGLPGHVGEKDPSWDDGGAYRLQAEFLAAVYLAEGTSAAQKHAAKAELSWILREKFSEPTEMTPADFE